MVRATSASLRALLATSYAPLICADLSFFSIGDWGKSDADSHACGDTMGKWATVPDFVLSLGDNFYDDGVASVTDPQWKTTFEDVFSGPAVQVPWFGVLGNHDYVLNATAQIDYSNYSNRWTMPSNYYTVTKQVSAGTTLQLIVLDTMVLAFDAVFQRTSAQVAAGKLPHASLASLAAQAPVKFTAGSKWAQMAWLEATLSTAVAAGTDYIIVAGHHPIRTDGESGDTPELVADVLPLLQQYGVDAYISGHDHNLQHLVEDPSLPLDEQRPHFWVSGAGCKTDPLAREKRAVFAEAAHGFMHVEVTDAVMTTRVYHKSGELRYAYTAKKAEKRS